MKTKFLALAILLVLSAVASPIFAQQTAAPSEASAPNDAPYKNPATPVEKRVKDLLQITKLYTVFEVFEDESSAVRSFA